MKISEGEVLYAVPIDTIANKNVELYIYFLLAYFEVEFELGC